MCWDMAPYADIGESLERKILREEACVRKRVGGGEAEKQGFRNNK